MPSASRRATPAAIHASKTPAVVRRSRSFVLATSSATVAMGQATAKSVDSRVSAAPSNRRHAARDVRGAVPRRLDERLVPGTRHTDGHRGQLVLAPGEVVVERGEGRAGLGQDLFDPRAGEPLSLQQRGAHVDQPISGVVHVSPRRRIRPDRRGQGGGSPTV